MKTPPYFHWANYTLKTFPLFFTSPNFSISSLKKTFCLEGEEAHNREGKLSQKLGGPEPKTGEGKLRSISIPDLRDKSHCPQTLIFDLVYDIIKYPVHL